jgi:DUF1365 family protein
MVYEVNNTFGQRHCYVIQGSEGPDGVIRQSCAKAFHVSPFMDMAMTYEFAMTAPGETVRTVVDGRDGRGELIINASFAGRRRELTDANLLRALGAFPLMTLKVVAAIYFEAARLWLKGLRLRPGTTPSGPVTVVSHQGSVQPS